MHYTDSQQISQTHPTKPTKKAQKDTQRSPKTRTCRGQIITKSIQISKNSTFIKGTNSRNYHEKKNSQVTNQRRQVKEFQPEEGQTLKVFNQEKSLKKIKKSRRFTSY